MMSLPPMAGWPGMNVQDMARVLYDCVRQKHVVAETFIRLAAYHVMFEENQMTSRKFFDALQARTGLTYTPGIRDNSDVRVEASWRVTNLDDLKSTLGEIAGNALLK